MGVNPLGLLVRQAGDGRMELLVRDLAFVYLAGGQGHEQNVMLDAVASIEGEMCLVPVCTALVGGLIARMGQQQRGNLVRHVGKTVGCIKRVIIPQIYSCHLVFLRFDFLGANRNGGGRRAATGAITHIGEYWPKDVKRLVP